MDLVYAIILSNIAQGVLLLVVGIAFIFAASAVVKVPTRYILPVVVVFSVMGAYAVDGGPSGPITLFVFSVIGYVLQRYDYPVTAVVVGMLLGRMLETEFLRTYQLSNGRPLYLLERPVALALLTAMLFSLALAAWTRRRRKNSAYAQAV